MTLRAVVAGLSGVKWGVVNWAPRSTEREGRRIQHVWGDRPTPEPSRYELEEVLERVVAHWCQHGTLSGLPRRDLRRVHHVLYFPPGRDAEWLGANDAFCEAYLHVIRGSSGLVKSVARAMLLRYPTHLGPFARTLARFREVLEGDVGLQTEVWRERQSSLRLFDQDGPDALARDVVTGSEPVGDLVEKAGLKGELEVAGFARAVAARVVTQLESLLRVGGDRAQLERALSFLSGPERNLRFPDLAGPIADALLLPFAQRMPTPETKGQVQSFLLTNLRDPRLFPARWQHASADARQVMLRWMVGDTLAQFFDLIDESTAQRVHWTYRKAFWSAYLEQQYIDDAWCVLGPDARAIGRRALTNINMSAGRLEGATSSHSVLLMRIGPVVVAEWSHVGTCRLWRVDSPTCPKLYDMHYTKGQLQSGPDHEQRHHGNEHYTWQLQLAKYIRDVTGRWVTQSEYRVRSLRWGN